MSKHTPGPWYAEAQRQSGTGAFLGWIIEHSSGRVGWESTAFKSTNREAAADDPVREANARLIAAAPDLLDALQACQKTLLAICHPQCKDDPDSPVNLAAIAIAKATGSAQ